MADKFAIVTGASSGIGYHLARIAAEHGYDLLVAADTPLDQAVQDFKACGAQQVDACEVELASKQGVDEVLSKLQGREVDALMANAGHGLGGAFLDQDFSKVQHVIDTNITGTIYLIQQIARGMVARQQGRILVTGSIAGFQPGAFQAVYNGSKAFVDSLAQALRNEIMQTGVIVSLLMPGPTDTEFFDRAGMEDTPAGQGPKADPAKVAHQGFTALMEGKDHAVAGSVMNKLQTAAAKVLPEKVNAALHAKMTSPGGE